MDTLGGQQEMEAPMSAWQWVALILGLVAIYGVTNILNKYFLVRIEMTRNEYMLAMRCEETKRWEILTGVVVNKPASGYPYAPPNPHREP